MPRITRNRWTEFYTKEKILKGFDNDGYRRVRLNKTGIENDYSIHRLAAIAFIPNPNNYPEVNHKDENPSNNKIDNLEWCTAKYNVNYGTRNKRVSELLSKIVYQYSLEGKFIKRWNSVSECTKNGFVHVSQCCLGTRKTDKGFKWSHTFLKDVI